MNNRLITIAETRSRPYEFAVHLGYAGLIWLPFAIAVPVLFHLSKDNVIDRFLGDLSYPIYLVHFMFASSGHGVIRVALMSVIVATGMVFLVERPVDRLRHNSLTLVWRRRRSPLEQGS